VLGAHTFADCRELARVELGGVTEFGVRAFYGCSGLYAVTFPACLEKVQTEAFTGYPLREVQVGLEEVSAVCLSAGVFGLRKAHCAAFLSHRAPARNRQFRRVEGTSFGDFR
jgi:hypothetical protein